MFFTWTISLTRRKSHYGYFVSIPVKELKVRSREGRTMKLHEDIC
jgi:hypothetical protein